MPQSPGVKYGPAGPPHAPEHQLGAPSAPRPQVPNYVERNAPRPSPGPAPRRSLGSFPSSHPFAQAQHQAAQRVQQAQRQLPPQRTYAPIIPRLPNPTMAQQYAAFGMAHRFQRQHLGPTPTRQQELQFHQQVMSDPRNAGFVQSLAHYLHAANAEGGTARGFLGGGLRSEGGARNVIDAAVSASRMISPTERGEREQDEQRWQREGVRQLERAARERQQHAGDLNLGLATINPSHLVAALATMKIPGLGALGLGGKLINEAIDIPGQTALAGAMVGGALRKKVEGEGAPLGKLGHELWQQITHPVRTFEQAPLSTLLMAGGLENAVGRVGGTAARLGGVVRTGDTGGVLGALRGAARGPVRPDMKLYGEGLPPDAAATTPNAQRVFTAGETGPATEGLRVAGRRYNADPLRAGLQKLYERKVLPNLPGELAQPDPFQATGWRLKRAVSGGAFHVGAVDIHSSAGEKGRRSMVRGTVNKVMEGVDRGGVNAKVGRDAIPLIVERILRTPGTVAASLTKERDKLIESLKATKPDGTPLHAGADKGTIKANLERVRGLLKDEAFLKDPSEAFAAAERFIALQKPLVVARMFGGQLKEDQVRAALFPYAQAWMGARYFTEAAHVAAERAMVDAGMGRHALQVGGRSPVEVQYHQHLQGEVARAMAAVKETEAAISPARRAYDRRVALQQSARARGSGPPRSSTLAERRAMEGAKADLRNAEAAHREAKAAHREATNALAEHKLPPREPGMRGPHGEQFTNEQILAHMRDNGVSPPGFLSHQRGVSGRGSYFRSILRQPALASRARTGAAFAAGTADHSWEALVGTIAKHASEAAQLEGRRRTLNRLGIGQHETAHEAELAAENFHTTPEGERLSAKHSLGELRPVHIGSQQIVDKGHIAPVPHGDVLHQFELAEHVTAAHRDLGKYTNMPLHVLERLQRHDTALHSDTALGRGLQAYQSAWRRAKLNTSMPHEFGVLQEQAIRLAAEQVGPMALATGRKYDRVLKQLAQVDKHGYIADSHGPLGERYRELENTLGGRGGLVESQRWNDAQRKGDQFQESLLHYVFAGGGKALATHPGQLLAKGWHGWRTVFEGSLAKAERAAYHAHMGKALRESGLIDSYRSVLKAQDDAVRAMIDGRMNQNMADALARKVDNMMGNWTHQTPAVRTFVGKLAPFGLWWLNSMRWLYRMPVSHPIKTAILASLYSATRAQRSAEGQGYGAPHRVPAFLQGTIPVTLPLVGRVKAAPTYYSPGGTLGATALHTAAEQLLPAGSSAYSAMKAENPLTGDKLKGPHGEDLQTGQVALNVLAEVLAGPTPFATQGQIALERGGKRYGTANWISDLAAKLGGPPTVRPGTEHTYSEVLGKMISPTRIIRPKATAGSGSPAEVRDAYRKALRGPSSAERSESDAELRKAYSEALGKR